MQTCRPDATDDLREHLLNRIIVGIASFALLVVPVSLERIRQFGWRPVFAVQIALVVVIWGVWASRARTSYGFRVTLLLFVIAMASLTGYTQFGPVAPGGPFIYFFLFVGAIFLSGRAVIGMSLLMAAGFLIVSTAAVMGTFDFGIDYQSYARSPRSWLLIGLTTFGFGGIVSYVSWVLVNKLADKDRELTRANATLAAKTEQAETANCLKGEIFDKLNIEFRTPLNGILGMSQLLRLDETDPERLEWIDKLDQSALRLGTTIERMIDFARIRESNVSIAFESFQIVDAIVAATTRIEGAVREKGLEFDYEVRPGTPDVICSDGRRLKQLLDELLDNALYFTRKGSIKLVASSEQAVGEPCKRVQIIVTDTGCGIPEQLQEEIFESFRQVDGAVTRAIDGNGIGLPIARRLARLLGGDVTVRSQAGVGSTFTVTLPVVSA